MKQRSEAIDIARGIAIILVVWGHALIGIQRAMGPGELGRFAIVLLFCVHMPLFFFISGMLSASMTRLGTVAFLERLMARVVYPYVLWSVVILFVHVRMSGLTNTRVEAFDLPDLLCAPPSAMWFLYVLFFSFLLTRLLTGIGSRTRLVIGIALTISGYFLDVWMLSHLRFVGMFLIGSVIAPATALAAARDWRLRSFAGICLAGPAVIAWGEAKLPPDGYPGLALCYLPAAFGGVLLLLAFAQVLERSRWIGQALAGVGQRTMPIFVLHILIVAGVRIILMRLGVQSATLVVAVALVAGVVLPILACALAERMRVVAYLGWARPGEGAR